MNFSRETILILNFNLGANFVNVFLFLELENCTKEKCNLHTIEFLRKVKKGKNPPKKSFFPRKRLLSTYFAMFTFEPLTENCIQPSSIQTSK